MAAPIKYNPKYHIPWIRGLARAGLTVEQIAEELGVTRPTIYNWAKKDSKLKLQTKKLNDILFF